MKTFFIKVLSLSILAGGIFGSLFSQTEQAIPEPIPAYDQKDKAITADPDQNQYIVLLRAAPLSVAYADARAQGHRMSDDEQKAYVATVRAAQASLVAQIDALGGREIARVSVALNAVFITADATVASQISGLAEVRGIQAVVNSRTQPISTEASPADPSASSSNSDYKEVVPLIGANTLRASGVTGAGVRVAVLDSGIDYTHAAFGGAGTSAAYLAAYGTSPAAAENKAAVTWPQGRVVGGYDFVGETWPAGPLARDPNPIAAPSATNSLGISGTDGSHGTSVADIIGGGPFSSAPNNQGVAPGVSLYAVKICSSVATSCSGIAIIQGIEWALDPDGDGSMTDAVDVINLSLGGNYGQQQNPSAEAANNAARVGVVVCCAAGNAGDSPYIVSSPSSAPEVISVAQTSMPSEKVFTHANTSSSSTVPFTINKTNTLSWAPLVGVTTGPVATPSLSFTCARLPAGELNGKIALIDRGTCVISTKVAYAQDAGAIGVILVNNVPGDPPSFSYGGIPADLPPGFVISIPALVISQSDGSALKTRLAGGEDLSATLSNALFVSIASTIAASSARGPSFNANSIKPEIGAPGGNLAAVSGSGTGFATFSGTSGATPVIAGSAALLRQLYPGLSPLEVKARLMNSAEANVYQDPVAQPGVLAPVSRIGSGEVRTLSAANAQAAAWVVNPAGNSSVPDLSFGFWRLSGPQSFTQTVRLTNYSGDSRSFTLATTTRSNPGSSGAVVLSLPTDVTVAGNSSVDFDVSIAIDPSKLPDWNTNSGIYGADGPRLTALEYGGFVTIQDSIDTLRLPWHVLPQKSHRALVSKSTYTLGSSLPVVSNAPSSITAPIWVYALTGTSPRLPAGSYPAPGDGFAVTDLQSVGVRLVNFAPPTGPVLEFAITTWDRHTHANAPALFEVDIDVNNDGIPDWFLFNEAVSDTDNRNVTYLQGATWSTSFGTSYTTTDFNSANVVLQVPLNRLGLTIPATPSANPVPDPLPSNHPFTFTVAAYDISFTGFLNDFIGPMIYTPAQPKYGIGATPLPNISLPAGAAGGLNILSTGFTSSPSQSGLLLLFPNGRTNFESKAIKVSP